MTKAEIVNTIVLETGINKKDVMAIVESLMEEIKNSLEKDDPVYLRVIGSFILKHRATKPARNISHHTTNTKPHHNIPAFKPAKEFIKEVSKQKE